MPLAARRLFDANGQEINRREDIQANQDYYVSSGESFKDPFRSIESKNRGGVYERSTLPVC